MLKLALVIPSLTRYFSCQRFLHIAEQFRYLQPICEFYFEHRCTRSCSHRLRPALCLNCFGAHMAFSRDWPVYQVGYKVIGYSFWYKCGFPEAEDTLNIWAVSRSARIFNLAHLGSGGALANRSCLHDLNTLVNNHIGASNIDGSVLELS